MAILARPAIVGFDGAHGAVHSVVIIFNAGRAPQQARGAFLGASEAKGGQSRRLATRGQ